ncbi:MAG: hypothetical protein U0793_19670 [Gemmataceae bacterium]
METSLLEFLKKRTLSEDQKRLQQMVKDLGDPIYKVRACAHFALIKEGTPAKRPSSVCAGESGSRGGPAGLPVRRRDQERP